jgi:single-strand DNA-binding protein
MMNNLNSILIEGNLVRDPEFRTTPKGTAVCTFSIASSRYFKRDSGMEKEVSYFNVESWGNWRSKSIIWGIKAGSSV